ncbi:FAD binding domain-containing protein [Amycolatopsis ultiminotia]|uniref:FAD binding domain-containing protein n=1 Tax=Amycolatopsis ultiminotia TaxID=543629 RepID=A0ABP6W2T3_9PSEU
MSRFTVEYPTTAEETTRLLEAETVIVGGGTLTVPALVRGELTAHRVLDLGRLGIDRITADGTGIHLGAMVSYQQLITSELITTRLPLLHRMASGITGGIQIRNQGTVGGAACAARPNSDVPAVLTALRTVLSLSSRSGTRRVPAGEFFLGAGRGDLRPGEFLSGLAIDVLPPQWTTGYYKLKFAESSWPVVTAACVLGPAGSPDPGEVVLGAVADTPLRIVLEGVERAEVEHAVADRVAALPEHRRWSDVRAGSGYRTRVCAEIACRAVRRALAARGESR